MLRILFSRLGKPHIGPPNAYSFNVPSVRASGGITVERGAGKTKAEKVTFNRLGGMCPRCEGMGSVNDIDLTALYDDGKSLNEGALTIPGYSMEGWYGRIFRGCGFFDPDKPISELQQEGTARPALQGADQDQGGRHQPDVRGADPADPEVVPVQGRGRDAARTSAPSWSGRSRSPPAPTAAAPGSPSRPGRRRSRGSTSPTPAPCRSATWPRGCAGCASRRWRRCWRR